MVRHPASGRVYGWLTSIGSGPISKFIIKPTCMYSLSSRTALSMRWVSSIPKQRGSTYSCVYTRKHTRTAQHLPVRSWNNAGLSWDASCSLQCMLSPFLLLRLYANIDASIATFLQQSDSLRWTSYMDECLRLLEEQQESINDEILVQQVRLQLINDKLSLGGFYGASSTSRESMRPSPAVYIRPMQAQLQTQLQGIMSRVRPNSQGYSQ